MTLLSTSNLSVARGGRAVLEGLNISICAGEVLILRGPNGSGKTTLLRTLAGLQPALTGALDVVFDTVAYGAHADGVKSTLTVEENLTFWAGVYGCADILPALQAFDLIALRTRQAGTLSAGQKRRLGLGRLRVTQRPLWVLDEPTVSLDKSAIQLFASAIKDHTAQGGAAIIATHIDLGFEAKVFDVTPFKAKETRISTAFDEAFL